MSDESEEIYLGQEERLPSKSLAEMLHGQYSSREFNSIFASTEFREHEIHPLAMACSSRFVNMILSTSKEELEGVTGERLQELRERLAIKHKILRSNEAPNAMVFCIEDCYLYTFGLARQSLNRKSRSEALTIASHPQGVEIASNLGIMDKAFTRFGISRKYKLAYTQK